MSDEERNSQEDKASEEPSNPNGAMGYLYIGGNMFVAAVSLFVIFFVMFSFFDPKSKLSKSNEEFSEKLKKSVDKNCVFEGNFGVYETKLIRIYKCQDHQMNVVIDEVLRR